MAEWVHVRLGPRDGLLVEDLDLWPEHHSQVHPSGTIRSIALSISAVYLNPTFYPCCSRSSSSTMRSSSSSRGFPSPTCVEAQTRASMTLTDCLPPLVLSRLLLRKSWESVTGSRDLTPRLACLIRHREPDHRCIQVHQHGCGQHYVRDLPEGIPFPKFVIPQNSFLRHAIAVYRPHVRRRCLLSR
jgi:hypothetical protein